MSTQSSLLASLFEELEALVRNDRTDWKAALENAKGVYLISDGTDRPYRVKLRNSCFANLQALGPMIKGHLIADVVTVIGTLDIVLGDSDR